MRERPSIGVKGAAGPLPARSSGESIAVVRRLALGILITDLLMLAISPAWLGREAPSSALFRGALAFLPFAATAVFLAWRNHTDIAAHMIVGGVFVGAWLFMPLHLGDPTDPYVLMGIAYAPFLAAFLLAPVWTAGYALLTLAGVSMLKVFSPGGESVTPNVFLFSTVFGGLSVWASVVRDQWEREVVTAQADVSQSQHELDAVFHASHEGQAFMDQAGLVLQSNDRLAELFGVRSIARGTPIHDVLPARLQSTYLRKVADCIELGPTRWSFRVAGKEPGAPAREIDATLVPVSSVEGTPMILLTCRDVTDIMQANAERDAAVQQARTRALNLISHHLRTPITPLRLDLFALRSRGEHLTEAQLGIIDRMERGLGRLITMVDLLVEAGQAGKPTETQPKACNIAEALTEAITASTHPVAIQNDAVEAADVFADPVALRVAMGTLLERLDPGLAWRAYLERRPGSVQLNFATGEPAEDEVSVDMNEPFADDETDPVFRDQLAMFVVRSTMEANGGRFDAYASSQGQRICLTLPAAPRLNRA